MNGSYARYLVLAVLTLAGGVACDSLTVFAPVASTIVAIASQSVVPLVGEALLTAILTEPSSTPVQNGTQVTLSTTLGMLDPPQAPTTDGLAGDRLLSGTKSGTATVSAFSGTATSNTISIAIGSVPAS